MTPVEDDPRVDVAARAMIPPFMEWDRLRPVTHEKHRRTARRVLAALDAPEKLEP